MKRVKEGTKKGDRDGTGALSDQGMTYCLTLIYMCAECSGFVNKKSERRNKEG